MVLCADGLLMSRPYREDLLEEMWRQPQLFTTFGTMTFTLTEQYAPLTGCNTS